MNVFITGASSGIGAALARCYATRGATLGLVARRGEMLETLRASLPASPRGHRRGHRIYAVDVTDSEALARAACDYLQQVGVPDIVIASAGISAGTLTECAEDLAVFRRIVETNLIATVATFGPFIDAMKREPIASGRSRKLVGVASVAGVRGLPGASAYCASKAAVIAYCESLRVELRGSAIRIVTLAPGYIATPMTTGNPYPMPFLMPVDRFAEQALAAIDRGARFSVLPWQMRIVAGVMRVLPRALFDAAFARVRRKPRADS